MSDDLDTARRRRKQRAAFGPSGGKQAVTHPVLVKVGAACYAGKTPTPERITTALDTRELYGPEVDRALGGEEPMVDEWESGVRVPSFAQMQALALLTGFSVGFFYQPPFPPLTGGWICGSDGCHPLGVGTAACPHCRQPMPMPMPPNDRAGLTP